jgi:hypothetical protein
LRFSILPVFGHLISCHDTGSIDAPKFVESVIILNTMVAELTSFTRRKNDTKVIPCSGDVVAASITK